MMREGLFEWASELLRRGATGVQQWNQWRQQNLGFVDLSGINLCQAELAGVNLRGVKLWDAQLAGADLMRAELAGAYLNRANLVGARLDGCNLAATNLSGAQLQAASVQASQLRYVLNLAQEQLDSTRGEPQNLPDGLRARACAQSV